MGLTEFELIDRITSGAPRAAADLRLGVGDDCAVIAGPGGRDWVVTADALIEGIHFRRGWTDMRTLGRKALSVNASDIASMGGTPRFYLVSIALPAADAGDAAQAIYDGMRSVAREHGMILIGGDTVASPSGIAMSITAIGEVPEGRAIGRSGARAGNAIFVTGDFGASALGLKCLAAGRRDDASAPFIRRHIDPAARVAEGISLARTGGVTAMIDASDGLAADLGHIAEMSGLGYEIDAASIPRAAGFDALAESMGFDPAALALSGGEDYELIFTADAERASDISRLFAAAFPGCGISRIGSIVADKSARIAADGRGGALNLASLGFDHFRGGGEG